MPWLVGPQALLGCLAIFPEGPAGAALPGPAACPGLRESPGPVKAAFVLQARRPKAPRAEQEGCM